MDAAKQALCVADSGMGRLQLLRIDDGTACGSYGRLGSGVHEMMYPQGVATLRGGYAIVDMGNHRQPLHPLGHSRTSTSLSMYIQMW